MSLRIDFLYSDGMVTRSETIHTDSAWSASTPYLVGDAVKWQGMLYICQVAHTNQQPPNTTYWRLSLHQVISDSIPSLVLQIEQNLTEFTSGDLSLVCANDDGLWDTGGFTPTTSNPTFRYPACNGIMIYQNNALIFSGDVDLKSVNFDRKRKTVAITFLGPLNRLSQWSAEPVRRATPWFSDYGVSTDVGVQHGSAYLTDGTKSWNNSILGCCLIDADGTVWTITGNATIGTGNWNSVYLANPVRTPPYWGVNPSHQSGSVYYPAAGAYVIRPMVFATRYAFESPLGTRTSSSTSVRDTGKGGSGPVDDPGWLANQWVYGSNSGYPGNHGVSTYYYLIDCKGVPFGPITGMTQHDNGLGLVYDEVDFPTNGSLTPDVSTGYDIVKAPYRNKLESLGPTISSLLLQAQSTTERGDILTLTSADGPISSQPVIHYFGTAVASSQSVEIQFVGPNASDPFLTAWDLWTLDAYTVDLWPTDGVVLANPYFRDTSVHDLVAALFAACGSVTSTPVINVPTFTISTPGITPTQLVPYADFGGKSILDALSELASISCCVVYATFSGPPNAPVITFHFQPCDVGTGSLLDLTGQGVIMEQSDSITSEWYYPSIIVKGSNKTEVVKGSQRPGATQLSVSTDYVDDYLWLLQILDRLWGFYGSVRKISTVKVRAEAFPNGACDLLSRVRLTPGDEWWVTKATRQMRNPADAFDLEVISAASTAYPPPDFEIEDLTATPEPPIITGLTASLSAHLFSFTWPYPEQQLMGFQRTVWDAATARPSKPSFFAAVGSSLVIVAGNPPSFQDRIRNQLLPQGSGTWFVDYQTVLIDGRMSNPCSAYGPFS